MTQRPVVAIDGPSGSGKTTVATELARRHGWKLVDTGAMYRALTWWVLDQGIPLDDDARIIALAERIPLELSTDPDAQRVIVDGHDVTIAIRSDEVTGAVSTVSAIPAVRTALVRRQRDASAGGGVVVEGRDIGTVVLPDATVKVFLTASSDERAVRRSLETGAGVDDVAVAMARRDGLDSGRVVSPLRQPEDALVIDSSHLSVDEVVGEVEAALTAPATASLRTAGTPRSSDPAPDPPATMPVRVGEGWVLWPVRRLARLVVRAVLRIRVIGEENIPAGPVLLAGNHTGFLDGPLVFIFVRRPAVFLAKSELFTGFWARLLRAVRQIPVHRGTPDRAALNTAVAVLQAGGVVGMFPEGTRGKGKLETVQDGVGYIAARGGGSVVPVVCRGTAAALPKGRSLPRLRAPVDIVFGAPFQVPSAEAPTRAEMHDAAAIIAAHLRALIDEVGLE